MGNKDQQKTAYGLLAVVWAIVAAAKIFATQQFFQHVFATAPSAGFLSLQKLAGFSSLAPAVAAYTLAVHPLSCPPPPPHPPNAPLPVPTLPPSAPLNLPKLAGFSVPLAPFVRGPPSLSYLLSPCIIFPYPYCPTLCLPFIRSPLHASHPPTLQHIRPIQLAFYLNFQLGVTMFHRFKLNLYTHTVAWCIERIATSVSMSLRLTHTRFVS